MEGVGTRVGATPQYHITDEDGDTSYALLMSLDLIKLVDTFYRVSSTVLSGQGTGPILPSTVAGEGFCQDSHLLQLLRGEGRRISFPFYTSIW